MQFLHELAGQVKINQILGVLNLIFRGPLVVELREHLFPFKEIAVWSDD